MECGIASSKHYIMPEFNVSKLRQPISKTWYGFDSIQWECSALATTAHQQPCAPTTTSCANNYTSHGIYRQSPKHKPTIISATLLCN